MLPALEELDVGGNPLTTGAGRKLLQLAQANPRWSVYVKIIAPPQQRRVYL